MAAMGDKIAAKRIAREAGVACVPGYDGEDQDDARLAEEAQRIGFPLLIKASAGGGGKGMRRVDRAEDFAAQLALARAEARAAFGDEHVLLERYLCRPRHLEVQLLGDRHGHLVHLHERECSIQRHYQKLVEEAPAPHLTDAMRERLHAAALSLGRAIGYDSAGTVEFVLDADSAEEPYFLEMNTRLQVEHPVTELVTGIDLVEAQIRSACGEPLPWRQQDIRCTGWAIEVRLNAESPAHGFRASFGPLTACVEPALPGVRVDSGIDARSEVSPHYDPLLGKLVAHGATRTVARERLRRAVVDWRIEGVATTQPLLADVLAHPAFDAPLCTGFLDTVFPGGWRPPTHARPERAATVAAAAWYFAQTRYAGSTPMGCLAGWRLTAPAGRCGRLSLRLAEAESGHEARVELALDGPTRAWSCDDEAHPVRWLATEDGGTADTLVLAQAGVRWLARVDGHAVSLWSQGLWQCWTARPEVDVPPATAHGHGHADDAVVAELPGLLARLLVAPGQAVAAGEPVAVLEAMKLMHTLCAPRDGTVVRVGVREGDTVARGTVLVELAPPSAP
jgi:3-methylcrotonyl-CoA carboxylase alpha subunit